MISPANISNFVRILLIRDTDFANVIQKINLKEEKINRNAFK